MYSLIQLSRHIEVSLSQLQLSLSLFYLLYSVRLHRRLCPRLQFVCHRQGYSHPARFREDIWSHRWGRCRSRRVKCNKIHFERTFKMTKMVSKRVIRLQPFRFFLPFQNIFHGAMSIDQIYFARPLLSMSNYRTPIKGLYLCGSGTHPGRLSSRDMTTNYHLDMFILSLLGGGVMGACGRNAANVALKDLRR